MSDFFAHGLHRRVDALMDRLYGAGVSSHQTIIEQINYLLFLRELSRRDQEMKSLGIKDDDKIVFDGKLAQYSWDNLLMLNPEALFSALEECYREIPDSTKNSTVRLLYRNAHLKIYEKPTLRQLIHELDEFSKELEKLSRAGQKDIFGDMYEYLLSKLSQAGTSGQFRTPRHIIEFIVSVLDPSMGETILDPACGTAGFLVKAYEHLAHKYTSEKYIEAGSFSFDKLNAKEKAFLFEHAFTGFDSDGEMIKFGLMNLYLHGLEKAKLARQNTLTDTTGTREKWDVILANPPFAGRIDRESVSEDLQMGTGATEILFLRYMLDHLTPNGRMGVIVPEGVLFKNDRASKKMRQMLLEQGLWCVASLPSGIFNPYAGVKTSIVFLDKALAGKLDSIMFVKIENDGFSLGAQRQPIDEDDLPVALDVIQKYKDVIRKNHKITKASIEVDELASQTAKTNVPARVVLKKHITKSDDFNLSGERYAEHYIAHVHQVKLKLILKPVAANARFTDWPIVKLGEICEVKRGSTITKKQTISGEIPVIAGGQQPAYYHNKANRGAPVITVSASGAYAGFVNFFSIPIYASDCSTVQPNDSSKVDIRFIYWYLKSRQEEIYKLQKGGGQPHVYPKDLIQIKVVLPPLTKQKEIVAEMDRYQKIIDGARQVIENWEPRINVDLDWKTIKLKDICTIERGASPRPIDKYITNSSSGVNWVKIGDTKNSYKYITETAQKITLEGASRSRKVEVGDFVLSNSMSFGRPYIMKIEGYIHDGWLRLKITDEQVDKDFLYYILSSDIAKDQFKRLATGGVVKNLNSNLVKNVEIPIPPLTKQIKIVQKIERERALVESNLKLIQSFEQRIQDRLKEI